MDSLQQLKVVQAAFFKLGGVFWMKIAGRLVYSGVMGSIALLLVNLMGSIAGFHIAFNIVSVMFVGFTGIPGLILLGVLKVMFTP